ncbi:MAG: hypothetical protein ACXW2C_12830, partial [Acidimicrobiia bacterium]
MAVFVLTLAACSSSATPAPERVIGIGDSLMLLAAPNIRQALSADYDPTIIAEDGRRIDEMLPPLRRALRDDTPVAAVI